MLKRIAVLIVAIVLVARIAIATEIEGVQPAALDQPRVHIHLRRQPTGLPLRAKANGEATINISRTTGSLGANGSGVLAQLMFIAIGKGAGTVTVTDASLKNSQQVSIGVALPALQFTVQ